MKVDIVPIDAVNPGPSDRRRLLALARGLAELGLTACVGPGASLCGETLVLASRNFAIGKCLAEEAHRRGAVVVYDVTDNLFESLRSRAHREGESMWRRAGRRAVSILRQDHLSDALELWALCDGIVVGSEAQAASFRRALPGKPVLALVDPVDGEEYRGFKSHSEIKRATVVWEGTADNVPYLQVCAPALQRLLERDIISLRVITDPRRTCPWRGELDNAGVLARLGLGLATLVEWRLETFAEELLKGDIAIAPLFSDDSFANSKPANKILGYAKLGLPVIVSPIPAYLEELRHGRFGLAASDFDEWQGALITLASDVSLRGRMGASGRAYAEASHTGAAFTRRYLEFVRGLTR